VTIVIVTDPRKPSIADQLSTWLSLPLFVGDSGTWFRRSTALRYQGVASQPVPILM
jgi:hypothetical protein